MRLMIPIPDFWPNVRELSYAPDSGMFTEVTIDYVVTKTSTAEVYDGASDQLELNYLAEWLKDQRPDLLPKRKPVRKVSSCTNRVLLLT